MKRFKTIDIVLGWFTFLIAAFVYCSTIEPTASFWDCPEFITTAAKLEVGHPPGAPFFMLLGNFFSHFAKDATQVAMMVNTMSALLSAITILFLFWTITHLVRKLIVKDEESLTVGKMIAIEASGLVGALIYTFSDTFWFSAVEGEVYAFSSAFTAVVFWLILKWEDHADEPHSDRWLVLIAFMTGLSIGVHLLNLLCIPAIVLVFVYRLYPNIELKGSLIALVVSFMIVGGVLYGFVPGIIKVGGWLELLFVNVLHCPFNTGVIIYLLLLAAVMIWAIYESYNGKNQLRENLSFTLAIAMLGIPFIGNGWKSIVLGIILIAVLWYVLQRQKSEGKKKVALVSGRLKNTILLCLLMMIIGYSSYALIVIRSSANPPMDQNSPEDIFTLGSYLSREQYGDTPLFYGHQYSSEVKLDIEGNYCKPHRDKGKPIYARKEKASEDERDSYFIVSTRDDLAYAQNMLFPRMHSKAHASAYESWLDTGDDDFYLFGSIPIKRYNYVDYDRCGEIVTVKMPSQFDNLRFFFSYQCNHMYWRYFMWNFAGRQNDIQGHGELEHGNWLSGIPFIDNARLGDQSKLPDSLKNNKGHNVFYCLPLLLGLIGLFWQAWRGKRGIRQFWVVFFLFFMTGLAIVIYLNQTPMQPRERDYAYAGSFYAFAIWCGIGVAAIIDLLKKYLKLDGWIPAALAGIICLLVPIQMASQTWDDHDRSGRYTCRDFGANYLMTLPDEGNPIIFTNGDNDTFPLWYAQEIEGIRTDARVCNLSYINTDWYIDQMKRPSYDSPALPISWPRIEYCSGTNEYVQIMPEMKEQVLEMYKTDPEKAKKQFGDEPFELKNILKYWVRSTDEDMRLIPTDTVYVTVDKESVKKANMMQVSQEIPDKMVISLSGKRGLYKGDLMMLEIIANCGFDRPIYVASTVGSENYMNLGDNFIQEGLANRISPYLTNQPGAKKLDAERTYTNLMTRFKYGGLDKGDVYLDETVRRLTMTHRDLFASTALQFIEEGKEDKAKELLKKVAQVIPENNLPLSFIGGGANIARAYAMMGDKDNANKTIAKLWKDSKQYLDFYLSLDESKFKLSVDQCLMHIQMMNDLANMTHVYDAAKADNMGKIVDDYFMRYQQKGGPVPNYLKD